MPIGKKTESIYQSKLCESFDFWVQSWLKKVDVSAIATMRLGDGTITILWYEWHNGYYIRFIGAIWSTYGLILGEKVKLYIHLKRDMLNVCWLFVVRENCRIASKKSFTETTFLFQGTSVWDLSDWFGFRKLLNRWSSSSLV